MEVWPRGTILTFGVTNYFSLVLKAVYADRKFSHM
jgi:hypothetical protein